jgi:hypothetical protein
MRAARQLSPDPSVPPQVRSGDIGQRLVSVVFQAGDNFVIEAIVGRITHQPEKNPA